MGESIRPRLYGVLSILAVIVLLLAACAPKATPTATEAPPEAATEAPTEAATEAPTEAAAPKSVTITFFEEPDNLNPWYTQMWFAWVARDLFLVGLWSHNENLEMVPEMAAEIPTAENGGLSEDGLTITIKLRQDAKWSDGEPVTAHDFVFTYEMIMADGNSIQTRYPYDTYVESVTALDDYTLQIKLTEPYAAWYMMFKDVLPKHILEPVFEAEGTIDNAEWNRAPTVGNGPFVFKEWQAASHIVFEANPNYWRGRPKLDQIFIRIVPDTEAQMAAIQASDTDIGVFLSAADKPTIDALENFEMVTVPSGYIESWFFNLDPNTGHPALQDVRVRQAIVMAVDRQKIIDELFYGLYKIPRTFWYDTPWEDPSIEPYPYDPQAAAALLDEAGWTDTNGDGTRDKDGVELVLRYSTTSGHELREAMQVVIQQMLAEVGIGTEIVNYSYDTIWNSYADEGPIATGQYDIAQWSDGAYEFPDPNTPYWLCSERVSEENPYGTNWYGVCDPELDPLLQEQAVTADVEQRIQLYYQIERIIHEKVYWVGLRTDPDIWAVNTRIQNIRIGPVDCFWNAFEWDVPE